MRYAIGLDLGGTNIKGLAITAKGKVLAEHASPTEDGQHARWAEKFRSVMLELKRRAKCEPDAIGLAAPGLAARDERSIAFMPERLPGLENLNWQKFFAFPRMVPVLNDAQAALLGEVWRGAAQEAENVVLLTLGTAVGGAAMVDGHLLRGRLGRAGHFGHISLNPDGAADITGTPGSLEDLIGDTTIEVRSSGRFVSTRDLVAASQSGNVEARKVWLASVRALAAGIASLVNALDPEVVILGGGIVRAGPALFTPLAKFLDQFEWRPGGAKVRVVSAELADRAGAFGAAWKAMQMNRA
jgi:glucokinase